jgi:hypothetical protein
MKVRLQPARIYMRRIWKGTFHEVQANFGSGEKDWASATVVGAQRSVFFDAATEFAEAEDCNSIIEFGSEKVFSECVDYARQIAYLREWATSCAACVSYPDWTA